MTLMNLYKIIVNLIENPNTPRFYRMARDYYNSVGKTNEAAAFSYLLKMKFGEDDTTNDTNDCEGTRGESTTST